MGMKKLLLSACLFTTVITAYAQSPETYSSSEILLRLKKLRVFGSVLYIAAHPDDENTRLLAYLAKGKLYKTGYLSLTRGDGGQNLIGDEQGKELGLIRTQELLAARRLDGAQQFFSRAYDFGFCKSTEEALEKWDRNIILSDVVWVIRKFRPDVIITRFPPDNRAGHGHHSASAVLAEEAFKAAADSTKFPEQFEYGVTPWQAKRLLWNTFNFGGASTQSEDQFKIEVGGYNALLGKSYGEIAAESRSQHKSQGFGIAAQRGSVLEYFVTTGGEPPANDLMDGVETTIRRVGITPEEQHKIETVVEDIIRRFSHEHPENSVSSLVKLHTLLFSLQPASPWITEKAAEVYKLIEICSGLYFEATANVPYVAAGDSLQINISVVNRGNLPIRALSTNFTDTLLSSVLPHKALSFSKKIFVPVNSPASQPYWLQNGMNEGHFIVDDQRLIGLPESPGPYEIAVNLEIDHQFFIFRKPVMHKYTDPVDGEIYQPLPIVPALSLMESPGFIFTRLNNLPPAPVTLSVTALTPVSNAKAVFYQYEYQKEKLIRNKTYDDPAVTLLKNQVKNYSLNTGTILKNTKEKELLFFADLTAPYKERYQSYTLRRIMHKHIPAITYFYLNKVKVIDDPITTVGKKIGYIPGAGDFIPEALKLLGYEVTQLSEKDILAGDLKQYDAIVTGIRAYNVHEWLNTVYESLMKYVYDGGNLVVQYNTSSSLGPLKGRIGPYDFDISRARVTDESAPVNFLLPGDELLNWPNKITSNDFRDWVQERGLYFAGNFAGEYKALFSANDPGENGHPGSLITTSYGKGRFTYTGLSLFRQLPAGKSYRLFANLVANPKYKKQ
ncbi:MAG: PIG-L family deacetylase [Chitinophagaceae bacterium]|nr:PIG-L family deacetylase [Chitinophagaceae bacterium]MCW5927461.1 PIG-L family deacetylase [Chitinophagaceae bacterium]